MNIRLLTLEEISKLAEEQLDDFKEFYELTLRQRDMFLVCVRTAIYRALILSGETKK